MIELHNVSFAYERQKVLDGIHLSLRQGEFLGLIGPNGSGKSTLVKCMLGLLQPDEGEVYYLGQPLKKFSGNLEIGYVSQKANHFNHGFPATVAEIVATGLFGKMGLFRRMGKKEWVRVNEVIELVGLTAHAQRSIGQLSGGQQQRALIARALVGEPKLLILDEPTVGIDAEGAARFYRLLDRLHREMGLTMFLVTHELEHVISYLDRVACLNRKLFFDGESHQFLENHREILSQVYGYYLPEMDHNNRWLRARGKEERSFTPSQ